MQARADGASLCWFCLLHRNPQARVLVAGASSSGLQYSEGRSVLRASVEGDLCSR